MRAKRRSVRLPTTRLAQLVQRDRRHAVEIVDVSRHGARLHGLGASCVGEQVQLEVASPHEVFAVPGTIVWNDRARRRSAGVCFALRTADDQRMLDGLLGELFKDGPGKGDVLVMVDDPAASRSLEEAIRRAGFAPIACTSAAEVIKHVCRTPGTSVVAAFVSARLPENHLAYLKEQWPTARKIVVPNDRALPVDVAAALRGAGHYG